MTDEAAGRIVPLKNRESQFPNRAGEIRPRDSALPLGDRSRFARFLIWVLFSLFLGLAVYANNAEYLLEVWHRVDSLLMSGLLGEKAKPPVDLDQGPGTTPTRVPDRPAVVVPGAVDHASEKKRIVSAPKVIPVETGVIDTPVSISIGFRPLGFKLAARQAGLELSDTPHPALRRLPKFAGRNQKYAALELARGQRYLLALDIGDQGIVLYVDKNRNGDLRDDGQPLANQGKGRFAAQLSLPLPTVSGIGLLKGEYLLWIFVNESAWRRNLLQYYCMTQLGGQLRLGGRVVSAFLADNRVIDGDYRNDGIYIDIDESGRIEADEFVPPGSTLKVGGISYSFSIQH